MRAAGLDRASAEADVHPGDPIWRLLRQHMEITLDARLIDHSGAGRRRRLETAVAQGMSLALKRIATDRRRLLSSYAGETTRALVRAGDSARPGVWRSRDGARAPGVERDRVERGARLSTARARGPPRSRAEGDTWPLLATMLGARVGEVPPLIVDFYSNPARFRVQAALELHTLPARFWSFVATMLVGQGLYETVRSRGALPRLPPRGRLDALRPRAALRRRAARLRLRLRRPGRPGRTASFRGLPRPGRRRRAGRPSLRRGRPRDPLPACVLRGLQLPNAPIKVEFRTREVVDDAGLPSLEIDGLLLMQPATAWGWVLAHWLLRQPEELGRIRYRAWPWD